MNLFVCQVCGHIEFNAAPDNCPVCWAPKEKFTQNNDVFKESAEKSPEAGVKHQPKLSVEKECSMFEGTECIKVAARIGETVHPMEEKHFIQWVDFYVDEKFVKRAMMTPSVFPGAAAHLKVTGKKVTVVERCNLHGWWSAEAAL
ncbi:MAG: hypothetical protein JW982_12630 [Spirochaetes bacterium]|nr:hypothetical protein [Spirochaetota bacterium]